VVEEDQALANGGLYEVFVGTADLNAAQAYWQAFGYRPVAEARLECGLAAELYGHDSAARVVRMQAGADHGLVRLIEWERPANPGLGTRGLRFAGNRWVGHFAHSLLTVANHAAAARAGGGEVVLGPIHFIDMGRAYAHLFGGVVPQPFADPLIALREMQIFRPETRQVVLERFGYDSPLLGTFTDGSLLSCTQIVQGCMVVRSDDPGIFGFYETVLGLRKALDIAIPWDEAQASREVFALTPGETHWNLDLDEPRSGATLDTRRSGRIKAFRFSERWPIEDVHALASPGALGMSNYTWRVHDITEAAGRARVGGALIQTAEYEDEFGHPAISLRAPDGYHWTLIEDRSSLI